MPGIPSKGEGNVAAKRVEVVFRRVEMLADYLDMGPAAPEFEPLFLQEHIHPLFRIVYWRDPLRMRIVRVWKREEDANNANHIR